MAIILREIHLLAEGNSEWWIFFVHAQKINSYNDVFDWLNEHYPDGDVALSSSGITSPKLIFRTETSYTHFMMTWR